MIRPIKQDPITRLRSLISEFTMNRRFTLDKHSGKLMGVSSGMANYLGWDVTLVRIAWVVGTVFGIGSLALVYLIVGLVAPES